MAAQRRGKYLLLPLDSGETDDPSPDERPGAARCRRRPRRPHTHVVAHLDDGREAWFVDPRTFGEVVVFDPANVETELPELARLGIDPIADPFDTAALRAAFGPTSRALKPLLLDQHVVAGIGNIYADEILHRAGLRPDRAASTSTDRDWRSFAVRSSTCCRRRSTPADRRSATPSTST
jgi:formamidopyrimidine-DNA glycosylase